MPVRQVPFDRHVERRESLRALEQSLRRDEVVLVAMDQQDRRPRLDLARDRVGLGLVRQHEQCRNSRRSRRAAPRGASPTCSAIMVPWLKPTSASADGRQLAAREFGIEEALQRRARPCRRRPSARSDAR